MSDSGGVACCDASAGVCDAWTISDASASLRCHALGDAAPPAVAAGAAATTSVMTVGALVLLLQLLVLVMVMQLFLLCIWDSRHLSWNI